nr:MAG TPA: hypothetical protein [Caudoviricetes sp.]
MVFPLLSEPLNAIISILLKIYFLLYVKRLTKVGLSLLARHFHHPNYLQ